MSHVLEAPLEGGCQTGLVLRGRRSETAGRAQCRLSIPRLAVGSATKPWVPGKGPGAPAPSPSPCPFLDGEAQVHSVGSSRRACQAGTTCLDPAGLSSRPASAFPAEHGLRPRCGRRPGPRLAPSPGVPCLQLPLSTDETSPSRPQPRPLVWTGKVGLPSGTPKPGPHKILAHPTPGPTRPPDPTRPHTTPHDLVPPHPQTPHDPHMPHTTPAQPITTSSPPSPLRPLYT